MSQRDWERFDALVRAVEGRLDAPTRARAHGEAIGRLLDAADRSQPPLGQLDWMDWERQKIQRLLRPRPVV